MAIETEASERVAKETESLSQKAHQEAEELVRDAYEQVSRWQTRTKRAIEEVWNEALLSHEALLSPLFLYDITVIFSALETTI